MRRRDDGKKMFTRGRRDQADAEQALSLTAQLMTDEFANALEVKDSNGSSETGELVTPLLRRWKQPPVAALQCDRLVWHGH